MKQCSSMLFGDSSLWQSNFLTIFLFSSIPNEFHFMNSKLQTKKKKNKLSFALSIHLTLMTTKAPISFEYLVQCRRCEELEKNTLTPTSRPSSCFEMSNHHTIGFIVFFAKQCRTISILLSQLDCYLRVRVAQISSISASSRYSSDRMKREEMNFQFSIFTFTRMTEHRSSHFELNINLVIK